jgi:RNAse (barnase) inhibitor barstar
MIRQTILDTSGIHSDLELHKYLSKIFKFPDYYGRNWDAFDECIQDYILIPHKIIVKHYDELESNLPSAAKQLRKSLIDLENEKVKIEFC